MFQAPHWLALTRTGYLRMVNRVLGYLEMQARLRRPSAADI